MDPNAGYSGMGTVTPAAGAVSQVYSAKYAESFIPASGSSQSSTFTNLTVIGTSALEGAATAGTSSAAVSLIVNGTTTSSGELKSSGLTINSNENSQGTISGVNMFNRTFTLLQGAAMAADGTATWTAPTEPTNAGFFMNPLPSSNLTLNPQASGTFTVAVPAIQANPNLRLRPIILSYDNTTAGAPYVYVKQTLSSGIVEFTIVNMDTNPLNGVLQLAFELI